MGFIVWNLRGEKMQKSSGPLPSLFDLFDQASCRERERTNSLYP